MEKNICIASISVKKIGSFLFALSAFANSFALNAKENVEFSSRAFDLNSGKLLYSEKHKETWKSGILISSKVLYLDPGGRILAKKNLDFTKNKTKPDFEYIDTRSGYLEGATANLSGIELKLREGMDSETRRTILSKTENLVVDAGFDYFIRENWEMLSGGFELKTNFAVPEHLDFYRFIIQKTGSIRKDGGEHLFFRIVPENRILRFITTGILVEYSAGNQRLISYEGITNVSDDSGKKYRARILFEYPNGRPNGLQKL